MSYAYKCDICGKLYDLCGIKGLTAVKGTHTITIRDMSLSKNYYNSETYHICPDCYAAIKKAMDARRKSSDPFEDDLK